MADTEKIYFNYLQFTENGTKYYVKDLDAESAIAQKADKTDVATISAKVDKNTEGIKNAATAAALDAVEAKADENAAAIAQKADTSALDEVKEQAEANAANIAAISGSLANKADSDDLETLQKRVQTNTENIATNATDITKKADTSTVSEIAGKVTENTSNISTNATNISNLNTAKMNKTALAEYSVTGLRSINPELYSDSKAFITIQHEVVLGNEGEAYQLISAYPSVTVSATNASQDTQYVPSFIFSIGDVRMSGSATEPTALVTVNLLLDWSNITQITVASITVTDSVTVIARRTDA